ncbi:biotin--[acetyl-CoA-carboxylase] ligase [Acetobacter conturbans]|uniref:biotin--[acetyl-CoA-carboxylase] ligase n=1 Tax=Acetobacter conturbans TaxID=1737472 RepID=UPI001F548C87|nr:biotin--[acetyl-CoA-carboxylase] ligase [Acetobacter conturbans]
MISPRTPERSSAVGHEVRLPGWRLACFDELPSTSDFCLRKAEEGEEDALAVLALHQTSPRGSRGRLWTDPGDSLALSALIRPDAAERKQPGAWAFIAALAFYDALSNGRSSSRLRIKWPNDIVLDGRKMAGILVEAGGGPRPWLVIGFGANLVASPAISGRKLACLAEWSASCAPRSVGERVLAALTHWRQVFQAQGFAAIRAGWLDRSLPVGAPLVVNGGGHYSEGRFAGIGEDGELLLDCNGRVERVITGEVLYGDPTVNALETGRAAGH